MLHRNMDRPYTVEEIIDVLRTLPPDMKCTGTKMEFDAMVIRASKITDPPEKQQLSMLTMTFERVPQ
jgi:hypothetical protein